MKKLLTIVVVGLLLISAKSLAVDTTSITPFDKLMYQVGHCESRNQHEGIWGDSGKAYGKYQFHKRTFDSFKVRFGHPEWNWKSVTHQDKLARLMIANGYGGHWTCYTKIKSTKTKKLSVDKYNGVFSKHKPSPDYTQNLKPVKTDLLTIRI
jgi:hypothetical protein